VCAIVFLAIFGNCAHANWITSWGDGDPADEWSIDQDQGTILILKGDGNDYKFYAETFQNSGVEGVINNITVAVGATGDFTLTIANSDPTKPGASHWQAANLRRDGDGYTWSLVGAELSGNLAADANGTPGDIICEEITDDITAATLVGDISSHSLQNLTITGNGEHDGNITLWPNSVFQKTIVIGDPEDPQAVMNGNIDLGKDFYTCYGHLTIAGDMNGTIELNDKCMGRIHPGFPRCSCR
jgi:hypothetical protein